MQTVNGKLIVTERQELDTAKEKITDIERRCQQLEKSQLAWEHQKSEVISTIESVNKTINCFTVLEQKNYRLTKEIELHKTRSRIFSVGTIITFCLGGLWIGNVGASLDKLAQLRGKQLTLDRYQPKVSPKRIKTNHK